MRPAASVGAAGEHLVVADARAIRPLAGAAPQPQQDQHPAAGEDERRAGEDLHGGALPPGAQQQRGVLLGTGRDRPVPVPVPGGAPHGVLDVGELLLGELHVLPAVAAEEPVLGVQGEDHCPVGPVRSVGGEQRGVGAAGVVEHRVVQRPVVLGVQVVLGDVQDEHDQAHLGAEVALREAVLEDLRVHGAGGVGDLDGGRRLGARGRGGERRRQEDGQGREQQ